MAQPMLCAAIKISIHALREEGDTIQEIKTLFDNIQFLSTPSARRAT